MSKVFERLYRAGDFKGQMRAYETRKRLAKRYAPLFSVERFEGDELLRLADLYTYAELFADADKALTVYLTSGRATQSVKARVSLLGVQLAQKKLREAHATAGVLLDEQKYDEELINRVQWLINELQATDPGAAGSLAEKMLPGLLRYAAENKGRSVPAVAAMLEAAAENSSIFRRTGAPRRAEEYFQNFLAGFNSSPLASDETLRRLVDSAGVRIKVVGSAAPAIEGTEYIDMPETGLEDLSGKVVLLDFLAPWCAPCVADLPYIDALQDKYKARGLVVIGVTEYFGHFQGKQGLSNEAELAELRKFKAQSKTRYGLLVGPGANRQAYGVSGYPTAALIDRAGRVRWLKQGGGYKRDLESVIEELLAERAAQGR